MSPSPAASSASGSLSIRIHARASPSTVHTPTPPPPRLRNFYIQPPSLPSAEKKKFISRSAFILPNNVSVSSLDEIIGECRVGNVLYYFARYQDGIAYKIPEAVCLEKIPDLVEEYQENKIQDRLPYPNFNPSATYIHPQSRIAPNTKSKSPTYIEVSSGSSEDEDDTEDEDYNSSPAVHEARSRAKKSSGPRFSRLRVRSNATDEDDSDSDFASTRRATRSRKPHRNRSEEVSDAESYPSERSIRRSTRTTRNIRIHVSQDLDGSGDDYEAPARGVKAKKVTKRRAARPAYGRVRDVTDLDEEDIPYLQEHHKTCAKCRQPRADILQKAKKGKKRKMDDDRAVMEPEELGGWVRCLRCPVVAHWSCLSKPQRDEILKAIRARQDDEYEKRQQESDEILSRPPKATDLSLKESTEFICASCMKGGDCFACLKTAVGPEPEAPLLSKTGDDVEMVDGTQSSSGATPPQDSLLFRCIRCHRLAHYQHLPQPSTEEDLSAEELAAHYQTINEWECKDCVNYTLKIDAILAWRPLPSDAKEDPSLASNYKNPLPREYLVKWVGKSYRRTQWIPHLWLAAVHAAKLKNFLTSKPKGMLSSSDDDKILDAEDGTHEQNKSRASSASLDTNAMLHTACTDAESRIPILWKTVDRVLDILFWRPLNSRGIVETDDDDDLMAPERRATYEHGEEPKSSLIETVERWEKRNKKDIEDHADELATRAAWVFVKWKDLGYEQATWDAPPRKGEPGFDDFCDALKRYAFARSVTVPKKSRAEYDAFDKRPPNTYKKKHWLKKGEDLDLGQDPKLKLMDFQVTGFNWLCDNWCRHQHCILADEMGLGKTVQISTFLGKIIDAFEAYPALIVVPNSTITNWVRELERWAPRLRVVPFYGEKASRSVIKNYELEHQIVVPGTTGAKFHVLVTTYETLTGSEDFTHVFKRQPRWECLVVDEGQRLKSDSSVIFRKLNELNTAHRVIMTGTPLNNNIRELFNLMNFLDPEEWHDLEGLEKEYSDLNEELVKSLHNRLRPYFLRRIKSEVLQLPPKNEVIVPITMAPLQREVYRSILTKNVDILNTLTNPSKTKSGAAQSKTKINNILMQLRKCLQHPYLYENDIEPKGLSPTEAHEKLVNASGKIRFLKTLLPKLKSRGHRVLLFSQFVIALDIIEDFLVGEGIEFLRLDGNTKQAQRQKDMDTFNAPNSDVFIYLLTTRAGGVGINLWTADTVIIFDPDFNPHQDLQAIARAHRFGQKKTCLVFKLMVKGSAEERIMQIGKKKLVLDHLIVQKMDDEDGAGENVQSILTYGAKALFEEQDNRDHSYTDNDVDKLIERTEKEGDQAESSKEGGLSFSFAKVWSAEKDSLNEVEDDGEEDSWAQTLKQLAEERNKETASEVTGRGAKRRAAQAKPQYVPDDDIEFTPVKSKAKDKGKRRTKSPGSDDDSDFSMGIVPSAVSSSPSVSGMSITNDSALFSPDEPGPSKRHKQLQNLASHRPRVSAPLSPIPINNPRANPNYCGLCGSTHGSELGDCPMMEKSEHLAEYRDMLMRNVSGEPIEFRRAAINAIDEVLENRGHTDLIVGQPLYLIEDSPKPMKQQHDKPKPRPRQSLPLATTLSHARSVGTPKRALSPTPDRPMSKKPKIIAQGL